jgi:PAS domain S-box-containing protein
MRPITELEQLQLLPLFAAHLRDHHLASYIEVQIQYSRVLNLPVLKLLDQMPPETVTEIVNNASLEYLNLLAQNKAAFQIEQGLERWRRNELPHLDQTAIASQDITLLGHVRKQALMHFAPGYCTDMQQLLQLAQEIDFFTMKGEDASFETYIGMLRKKIEDQSYLTNKITNTSPGIIYVVNLLPYAVLFANQTAVEFFGYSSQEFIDMGTDAFAHIIHPLDLTAAFHFLREISSVKDTEVRTLEFRMKNRSGQYVWMRNYFSVFRRDAEGNPTEIIGNILNIQAEREMTEQLQQSQTLYQQAQAMAKLGNWSIDLITHSVIWSDEMYRIYERPASMLMSVEEWHQYIHPEDLEGLLAHFEYCKKERLPYDRIHRIVLPGGKIKVLHRKAEIIFDESGEAIRMLGTTQDVTEQNRIQQELKENQMFLRKITDATPFIITTYNVHSGQYVFVSQGLNTLLGYPPEQLLQEGNHFFARIIHPDDFEIIKSSKEAALEGNFTGADGRDAIREYTYRLKHANGHYCWFHTYTTVFDRNAQGKIEHMLNVSLDVTAQHEASQKIEEQEHFIQNIADASPTILYVYDVQGANFAYVNREIYFVLGYTPDEMVAMGEAATENLYHPEDLELLPERRQSSRKIQENDVMIQYECRLKNKAGEWQWFLVREVVFITDSADRPSQIVGAALDISKRKEMEKALLQNSFLLEQSNASLEEFAYVASHDLKEPLRKISTFGDRLSATQSEIMSPEGKIYLSKIVDASQRMQTMISDILSISMISGNKSYEPFSLQKILEETLHTLEFKIEQKGAIIESDGLPVASIVPAQFRQLFQNLIANSLKFVADGVRPHITITHSYLQPADVIGYVLQAANRYLKIELADNGIGFENEFAGKIFLIFQRLHGRSEYEGSGIGLAICKKIVEHHGGLIFATGTPGHGSKFTVIMPA